ncbi:MULTISPECIES: MotE family protein [Pontibacillus]|uniref:MgtE protein n=1 Tax=Pontibacillus chungwhensis TaxID=265426 RepID=A0ABY8V4L9_9BACI|nr:MULTISPECIES: MgtE protein [Pontibacillus]MCD5322685.1 MgtE protein [Pontibacillus sp. HN14]WIF99961.1 MgtE protein [Pontibacillus chungwhensis]
MASLEEPKQKSSKFQWFVFVILIPLILAITVALIIMTVAGVNIFEKTKQFTNDIPVISTMVNQETEENQGDQTVELEATIEDQNAQLEELQSQLTVKDQKINELNNEIEKLTNQLNDKNMSDKNKEEVLSNLSSSFKNMDPEEAAAIVSKLDQVASVNLLEKLPNDERGKVLAALDPELAATITSALMSR